MTTQVIELQTELQMHPTDQEYTTAAVQGPPAESLAVGEDHSQAAEPEYPTGTKLYFIILSVSLVLILGGLDGTIVSTAVPSITDHFHTVADVGWYSSAYKLTSCSFQFMFGKMYKVFSVKRVFLISIVIFMLGSLLCAAAPSSKIFVLGRAVTGLGCSGVIAGCFTLLVQIFPLRKRPVYAAMFGAVESLASVVAPILGGVLTQKLSWRWCFWISLPIGAVTLITMAIFLSDPKASATVGMGWKEKLGQLDLIGNLVFVPAITFLFIALSWAGIKYPWSDPKIIVLLVAFAVLLAVFAWVQHRKQDMATLPPRILKKRNVIAGFIFSSCCNGGLNVVEYYIPTYFQAVRGYSPAKSGYMMLPVIIGSTIGFLIGGSGTSIGGYYTPFMIAGSILMPVATGLMTTWKVDSTLASLIAYSGFIGIAGGIGFQGPQTAVQSTLGDDDAPLGLAVILFAQGFGPALFISIAQTIFTNRLTDNLHHFLPNLDARSIEDMGFNELKTSVGARNLDKALLGFDESLIQTWYLAVGLTGVTMIGSLAMEWRSVKHKRN